MGKHHVLPSLLFRCFFLRSLLFATDSLVVTWKSIPMSRVEPLSFTEHRRFLPFVSPLINEIYFILLPTV